METSYSFTAKLRSNRLYVIGDPFILTNEMYHKYILSIKNCSGVINKDFINIPMRTRKECLKDTSGCSYYNKSGNIAIFAFYMLKDIYQSDIHKVYGIGRVLHSDEYEKLILVDNGRINIYINNILYIRLDGSIIANMH